MIKQVIIIRRDLKMRRGKEISQGSHASNAFLLDILKFKDRIDDDVHWWINNGYKKVVVYVKSYDELSKLYNDAQKAGLRSHYIIDEGLTEFGGVHTLTAVAIGPNRSDDIDVITGNLPLY